MTETLRVEADSFTSSRTSVQGVEDVTRLGPTTAAIFGPLAAGLVARQPISVRIERDHDGSFIVSDETFAVYGCGASWDEALEDYKSSLAEYRDLVAGDPGSAAVLDHLNKYLAVS